MIKFNYILNDLALSNLITRCLYSESADYSDKQELENQIKLIQKENKQLIANWNKLKEFVLKKQAVLFNTEYTCYSNVLDKIQELEQGSDNNE